MVHIVIVTLPYNAHRAVGVFHVLVHLVPFIVGFSGFPSTDTPVPGGGICGAFGFLRLDLYR